MSEAAHPAGEPSHYQRDEVSGYTLIGGDMFGWSDLTAPRSDSAALVLAADLIAAHPGRVLLVGPTASTLLDGIADDRPVTVLVRGTDDARSVQHLGATRTGLVVRCGGIDRFEAQEHDVVVALDPLRTLITPDSRPIDVAEALQLLADSTAQGGLLVAEIANSMGLDEVQQVPAVFARDNFDHLLGEMAGGLFHHQLASVVDHTGLTPWARYATAPTAHEPSVLVRPEALDDPATRTLAKAFATAAAADHAGDQLTLGDPAVLVGRVFEAQSVDALAPSWIALWHRGAAPSNDLPAALVAEPRADGSWRAQARIDSAGQVRSTGSTVTLGAVQRELPQAYAGDHTGDLFEAVLGRACRTRDLGAVRTLVGAYADWLRAGEPATALFRTIDNTLVVAARDAAPTFAPLDPSWTWLADTPIEVAVARALHRFAHRLVRRGSAHPWAADAAPDQITESLALMAGLDWVEVRDQVASVEERLADTLWPNRSGDRPREITPGALDEAGAAGSRLAPWRETVRRNAELTEQLKVQNARIEWLERHLEWRDRQFANLEKKMNSVMATTAYKVTDKLGAPKRKAVGSARALVMDQLPPGFKDKAEKMVRRMLDDGAK